jgi:flagellar motor switch protein FliM
MSEFHVLSNEEVEAILKVSQDTNQDLSTREPESQNSYILSNINDLTRLECEKILISFLRKKVTLTIKPFQDSTLSTCLRDTEEKNVYCAFKISSKKDSYGLCIISPALLHQTINLLYGGSISTNNVTENPGKIGTILAEKICKRFLEGFVLGCQEYGTFSFEITKTSVLSNLTSNLHTADEVYLLSMSVLFDEVETTLKLMIPLNFLDELIHTKAGEIKHRDRDSWRNTIKNEVIDSYVTVSVALPDISMQVNDFMGLKEGDMIPIGDPTLVYVCLNNLKLFNALAGQSNAKRVAKIIGQI